MAKSKMVVADLYELPRSGGKFVQAGRKQKRTAVVVTRKEADEYNEDELCSKYYDIDEKATEAYYKFGVEDTERRKMAKEAEKISGQDIIAAIARGSQGATQPETPKALFPEGKPTDDWSKGELTAWCDANGVDYDSRKGRAKLFEFIKSLES